MVLDSCSLSVNKHLYLRSESLSMTNYPVGASAKTFHVIEVLVDVEEAGVTEIAEQLDISKGSAYNHLTTLEKLGYATRQEGRYRPSLRFLDLGARIRSGRDVYQAARSAVDQLAHSSGEVASLVIEEANEAVFIYRAGDDEATPLSEGSRMPLHACAAGKAILANKHREVDGEQLRVGGTPTEKTITDPDAFARELQTVRDQGLAFDRGESFVDRRAVAAPIVTNNDRVAGAVTVAGTPDRMSGKRLEEDMPGLVLSAANKIVVDRITV